MSNKKTPPEGGFLGAGFGLDKRLLATQGGNSGSFDLIFGALEK